MAGRLPQWAALSGRIAALRPKWDPSVGPANAQALVRTFGVPEKDIRVTLYRDNHAWCPYCHKVWLQLELKRIPYRTRKVNMWCYGKKQPWYTALCPSGMLPAMELDGELVTESDVIMRRLESSFPKHTPLLPPDGTELRRDADVMLKLERKLFSRWLRWQSSNTADARLGSAFEKEMDTVDAELRRHADGPYFLGKEVSYVDCAFTPFLERMAASLLYYKGLKIKGGRWSAVNEWFAGMERQSAFRGCMSDFYTHVHDLPPQMGNCGKTNTPEQLAAAAAIDGTDGVAWRHPLPSPFDSAGIEPLLAPDAWDQDAGPARLEAAAALVRHADKVVHIGTRPASRDDGAGAAVDEALRAVTAALVESVSADLAASEPPTVGGPLTQSPVLAAAGLRYIRDRISVPRDMSYLAALQLRATLSMFAATLDPATGTEVAIGEANRMDQNTEAFHASVSPPSSGR